MPLIAGSRLGPYEIVNQLGAGGMGEVYKARDSRLDRTVAIKILPSHLADNPDLKERFEREARTISSLSHPHICVLHDIGRQDGVDYLVMEFLEGETLASRLARGPLPLDQVLRYGVQIADAVDRAHRRGIVHRDLKPGNIMLTRSGAKLLDFGLAKLRRSEPAVGLSLLPTQGATLTAEGSIVGTLQYMAPEQLEGKEADARTDIFALGAVIYEMATGKKAFEGKSQASLIAAILDRDPASISAVQPMAPAALDHIVRKCLVKSPDERWQSAHDLTTQLQWIAEQGAQLERSLPQKSQRWRAYVLWSLAALAPALAAILAVFYFYLAPDSQAQTVRFTRTLPEDVPNVSMVALSPDGSQMAFVTDVGDNTHLWVHSLNSLEPRQLPGTEGAMVPFWSPDNRFIGFFAQGKLKKIAVAGAPPLTLCDAWNAGGAWSRDGVILFTTSEGIQRVSPAGGVPSAVTKLDRSRQETSHVHPQFLPDGRSFLFFVGSTEPKYAGIYVASLDSGEKRKILDSEFNAVYTSPGYLLSVRDGTLWAQPFDYRTLQLQGDPLVVTQEVHTFRGWAYADFSASENGVLIYGSSALEGARELVWLDRQGRRLESIGTPAFYRHPAFSPDGRTVAVERFDRKSGEGDVWVFDLARGVSSRVTFAPLRDSDPIWSPDGRQIIFASRRGPVAGLYLKNASGTGEEKKLLTLGSDIYPLDCSPDGRFALYVIFRGDVGGDVGGDIEALPLDGSGNPVLVVGTKFDEVHGRFSPDGKWIAYASNESGQYEVYVQPFPLDGRKWVVSKNGGAQPQWRRDGKELFYLSTDKKVKLQAVRVTLDGAFQVSAPTVLFETGIASSVTQEVRNFYVPAADGQRFLFTLPVKQKAPELVVVLNWLGNVTK